MTGRHTDMCGDSHDLRVFDSVLDMIASPANPTPMVRLRKLFPAETTEVLAKLEWYNPFGSVKDRIAKAMLDAAGPLDGKSIIEASSGNTGIALAAIAAVMGVPVEIAVPSGAPNEKKVLLKMLGAELWESEDELCPLFPYEGARGMARGIAESPANAGKYFYPNQYESEVNVNAHYKSTGPEIWAQTEGRITAFFAGYGTTGTLSGVGKFLKEKDSKIKIIGVEPSVPMHRQPGLKNISKLAEEFIPGILDRSVIDETFGIEDKDAYEMTKCLARTEGLLAGPSCGTIVKAVEDYLARETAAGNNDHCIVAIMPDNAFKYATFFEDMMK